MDLNVPVISINVQKEFRKRFWLSNWSRVVVLLNFGRRLTYFIFIFFFSSRAALSWELYQVQAFAFLKLTEYYERFSYEVLELTAVITNNIIIVLRLPAEQKWLTKLKLVGRFELRKELTIGVNA